MILFQNSIWNSIVLFRSGAGHSKEEGKEEQEVVEEEEEGKDELPTDVLGGGGAHHFGMPLDFEPWLYRLNSIPNRDCKN